VQEALEVLARKYRPKNFNELIGQENIAQTLSLALDANRLSHAYLFSGLRGSGKTSTARIFAKALICEKGISHNPCGKCQNCIMALENRHVDIVEMDGASSRKIDDIRDLIEQTKYKPAVARFKIFIIDEAHMLTKEAFNALLKTLEEPPSYIKFILATTDPLKLPPTILSRTQHFRFKKIATKKIVDHLTHILNLEGIEYEDGALEIIARSGNGSLRDTLTLLDQAIIYSKNYVDITTVTDMLGLVDPEFFNKLFDTIFNKDREKLIELVKVLEDYEATMVIDELIAYLKDKLYSYDAKFSTLILDRFFRILSDSKYLLTINADNSFVLSLIFFKMIEALNIKEIDQMIEALQKEIKQPQVATIHTQTTTSKIEHIKKIKQENKTTNSLDSKFEQLILKIQDRSYELSQCFKNSVEFKSFENNILVWESCADDECKKLLKHGYGVIRQFVREIFGISTTIKGIACSKTISQVKQKEKEAIKEEVITQVDSMVEEAEGITDSCVTNYTTSKPNITNSIDITKEPMVQKIIEMFEVKDMVVQNKI
jgi:DNA polymerase-3 subunit gamma/tau